MKKEDPSPPEEAIILLEDLVPRHAGKLMFGQAIDFAEEEGLPSPASSPCSDTTPEAAK